MKPIDISWPLTEDMTMYKERKLVRFIQSRTWDKDKARQSEATIDSHAGTHIDAPAHYTKDGKTIDEIGLDRFTGKCRVVDLSKVKEKITRKELETSNIKEGGIILLKTKNSRSSPTAKFNHNFVYLEKTGAKYLADKNVKTVGVDYLGIERDQPGHETHKFLLGKNILIIEGLRLGKVKAGNYKLVCLPLAYKGMEAAPARAVLLK